VTYSTIGCGLLIAFLIIFTFGLPLAHLIPFNAAARCKQYILNKTTTTNKEINNDTDH